MLQDRSKLSQNDLAKALGLAPSAVTKLKKQGMPVHSVEAALEWRRRHIRMDLRAKRPAIVPPIPTLQQVTDLAMLAHQALQCGEFGLIAPRLRSALQALPPGADVAMPLEVWDALTADTFERIAGAPRGEVVELDEAQAETMGAFWLSIASGLPTDVPQA